MYRQSEHRKGTEGVPSLNFYSKYPTRDNIDAAGIRSGYFEQLIKYRGDGFKRTQVIHDAIAKHNHIFSWD